MSGLTSLNISLPHSLKEYVEEQVQESGYSTPSEFIRALLRDDHRRRAQEKLQALLLEGVKSGEPLEITPAYWERKRRQLVARFNRRKAGIKSPGAAAGGGPSLPGLLRRPARRGTGGCSFLGGAGVVTGEPRRGGPAWRALTPELSATRR